MNSDDKQINKYDMGWSLLQLPWPSGLADISLNHRVGGALISTAFLLSTPPCQTRKLLYN